MNDFFPNNSDATGNSTTDTEALVDEMLEFVGDSQDLGATDRRFRDRYPICCTMLLTPIDEHNIPLTDNTSIIVGKDLSRRGISFSHDSPLSYRRAIISLSDPVTGQFVVEAEITWTRLTLIGLYESGCRLIRKIVDHKPA